MFCACVFVCVCSTLLYLKGKNLSTWATWAVGWIKIPVSKTNTNIELTVRAHFWIVRSLLNIFLLPNIIRFTYEGVDLHIRTLSRLPLDSLRWMQPNRKVVYIRAIIWQLKSSSTKQRPTVYATYTHLKKDKSKYSISRALILIYFFFCLFVVAVE